MTTAKILVVDDDKEYCELLSRCLTRRGYTVRTAEHIDAAIEELERDSYAIVTVDMMFRTGSTEVICGEDLLIYLRDNFEGIRCIVVSGSVEVSKEEIADFGRKYGARFVEKQTLNTAKFVALVREVLQEVAAVRSRDEESIRAKSLRKQLDEHRSNLNRLREQKATFAKGEEPLHLLNQIDYEEGEIARLEAELHKFEKALDHAGSD